MLIFRASGSLAISEALWPGTHGFASHVTRGLPLSAAPDALSVTDGGGGKKRNTTARAATLSPLCSSVVFFDTQRR